jgi:hypothetical protein
MRLTWLVLGVVVAGGAVAFLHTDDEAQPLPPAARSPTTRPAHLPLQRPAAVRAAAGRPPADLALSDAQLASEKRARAILQKAAAGHARVPAVEAQLRREAWDSPSARHWAYQQGRSLLASPGRGLGADAIRRADRARRLLSRVVYEPDMFAADGTPTPERDKLVATIQSLNRRVMHYEPGLPGVTVPYDVPPGLVPVQIVSRLKLPMGSNAILFWNQGGNLDAKRLRAGERLLIPQEELSLQVHLHVRRMGIFLGDWFVKEFRVGIGKPGSPTPTGLFHVHSRARNPDWWQPGGKRIPYGDPRNELGSAWIAIVSAQWPLGAGYGLHGTNKPATVGTRCSNGCVRLANADASELYDWVRTASAGGKATQILIR